MKDTAYNIFKAYIVKVALRYVGGPYVWIASKLIPRILDKFIKPHFYLVKRKISRAVNKKQAQEKIEDLENANTPDSYIDRLNRK